MIPPDDDQVEKQYPLLWGLITQDSYRDGTVRVLPTIKVERIPGGYRVTLQDHASHLQIAAMSCTLDGIARALESAMRQPEPEWRLYKSKVVQNPTKRKKVNES